jgi:hypothetical protein
MTGAAATAKTPEQLAAPAWAKARAGLCWVLLGLFFLTIPGFVGFGKVVYTRIPEYGGELPTGKGWIEIPPYVNSDDPNSIPMTKIDQLNVALYAIPVVLGLLFVTFGRITAGAAPPNSGARGLFLWSGVFSLLALTGLVTAALCSPDWLNFKDWYYYAGLGFIVTASLAEFWFLTGLATSGVALKRPRAARAVGLVGFVFGLTALIPTIAWPLYNTELRPKEQDFTEDWKLYEQAAVMLGWLLLIGVYWRAVRTVREAIRDFLVKVEN